MACHRKILSPRTAIGGAGNGAILSIAGTMAGNQIYQ